MTPQGCVQRAMSGHAGKSSLRAPSPQPTLMPLDVRTGDEGRCAIFTARSSASG